MTREKSIKFRQGNQNMVEVVGKLEEEFQYSHTIGGKVFYKATIVIPRLSGTRDYIPVIAEERLIMDFNGKNAYIKGEIHSINYRDKNHKIHVKLFLHAREISFAIDKEIADKNFVLLEGYLCKKTEFRFTPSGRKLSDFIIAVNRKYERSDYIVCLAWGDLAEEISKAKVGDKIKVTGRFQSRQYFKAVSPGSDEGEYRTTYEVSINTLDK